MQNKKISIYFFSLLLLLTAGWFFLQPLLISNDALQGTPHFFIDGLGQLTNGESLNFKQPLAVFILQLVIIVLLARVFGYLFTKIKQPAVIGEIAAGIVLGPSLIGSYFPGFSAFVFPAESLSFLQFFSQVGLMLFMFVVGMEVDLKTFQKRVFDAFIISHSGIFFSFLLGLIAAYFLYETFAPAGVPFIYFALFMGISMSTTAFPLLARIIQERGLTRTPLGVLAITTAAVDDITAWCLLAVIIAVIKSGGVANSLSTIILTVVYVIFMLKVLQPFLQRLGKIYISKENMNKSVVAFLFVVLLFSSYLTEIIGIHPLVGAFIAGIVMPDNVHFKKVFINKIEDFSLVLLLPLFFIFTGLRTQINTLDNSSLWLTAFAVIATAISGKFIGAFVSSKLLGNSWKNSLSMGVMMNTRGLMELIILNIGYDLGILGKEIFTILVLMALVTTFITNPLLEFIDSRTAKS